MRADLLQVILALSGREGNLSTAVVYMCGCARSRCQPRSWRQDKEWRANARDADAGRSCDVHHAENDSCACGHCSAPASWWPPPPLQCQCHLVTEVSTMSACASNIQSTASRKKQGHWIALRACGSKSARGCLRCTCQCHPGPTPLTPASPSSCAPCTLVCLQT